MGWLYLPKLKDLKYKADRDVVSSIAVSPCRFCGKEIGYETKYYMETFYDDDGQLTGRCYEHFVCAHTEAAKLRQA